MRILLTNDDGIDSPGLVALARVAADAGFEVVVAAPAHEHSGASASIIATQGHAVTAGGRVLCVCALGDSVAGAQQRAYAAVAGISWPGEFHRHDIGWRAIERERSRT